MNAEQRIAFFEQLKANNPKPSTELEYSSPFELLTAVLLSAQATDISVNKGTRRLFPIANTPAALLALGEAGVRPYIQHIGLYKTKGRHLQETCRILMKQHGGEVPKKREDLEALPGGAQATPTTQKSVATAKKPSVILLVRRISLALCNCINPYPKKIRFVS